jgi:divalent metal cation (Fe/Co/Zn/Cd) transporter
MGTDPDRRPPAAMNNEPLTSDFMPPQAADIEQRARKGQRVVNLGLLWNTVLAIGKTVMGILGHSTALLSDGINSTSDVAYYIVVKIFMKLAGQPPDPEHPYGHQQMESIAALTVGSFVITTAIAIFWTASGWRCSPWSLRSC